MFFGVAPAACVKRHIQRQANHLLALGVAGAAKVTAAAEPLPGGLRHQVQRGRAQGAVFAHFFTRRGGLGLLALEHRVVLLGQRQPVRQRLNVCRRAVPGGRLQLQAVAGQAGDVRQFIAGEFKFAGGRQCLRLQATRAGRGFVRVGDRNVAQRKAVFGFGQGFLDGRLLLLQERQPAFGQHGVEVALRGLQHPVLLRRLPFNLARFGRDDELLALRLPLDVVKGLARIERPARGGAAVDRGRKRRAGGCRKSRRCSKLRSFHLAVGAGGTGAGTQTQLRPPQRGGLLTLLRTGCAAGIDHATLRVVLAGRLPDLQQVGGMGCQGADGKRGANEQGA